MTEPVVEYRDWIGRMESLHDPLCPTQAAAAAATFDEPDTPVGVGDPLPPLWHWFYFLPRAMQQTLNGDGHPARGEFMPPVPYPRRMFAGARLTVHRPLLIGHGAQREGVIRDVVLKSGRTGALAFVTVGYRIVQDGVLCIEEEQDIVYREPGVPVVAPNVTALPPLAPGVWSRMVSPDSRLLFRFSALTFNAHRIHYDRAYAMEQEGYPGLVVHGPLTAMLMVGLVRQHSPRSVRGFTFRGLAPLFDLSPFRISARPVSDDVHCLAEGPDGKPALEATVQLQ